MQVEGITKTKDLIMKEFEITAISKIAAIPVVVFYKKPKDYPEMYVARLFDKNRPTNIVLLKHSLEALRKAIPPHMVRINTSESDEKQIIESYI